MSFLFGVIAASYDTTTPPPPPPPPPPPTCTPTCGACSYTYGDWSDWSICSGSTQTRTRTVTCTQICQASDCSIYTQTSTSTETESRACETPPPPTTWYCTTAFGSNYTSSSDVSFTGECNETVACSTSGYPSAPPC
jgi:hypothetical protein